MRATYANTVNFGRWARYGCFIALGACAVFACTSNGMAAVLVSNGTNANPIAPNDAGMSGSAFIAAGPLVSLFTSQSGPLDYSGSLTSTAYTNDLNSPYGTSAIDLVYQLHNDSTSGFGISSFSATGFNPGGLLGAPALSYLTNVGILGPTPTGVIANRSANGFLISLNGSNEIVNPGQTATFIIYTNATSTFIGLDSVKNNDVANKIPAIIPSGPTTHLLPVPEPASMIAWGLMGLVGLSYSFYRRRSLA